MTAPHDTRPEPAPRRRFSAKWLAVAAVVSALAVVGLAALLLNIFSRQQEARTPFYQVVTLNDTIDDPAIWGKNFPLQYDDYRKTVDQQRTRYGGSEALPHPPTDADPRSLVAQSRLDEDPRLREMWAGYAFATDFREERGHAYMLEDQEFTRRQQVTKQPGTCLNCHASVYVPFMKAGNGDIFKGFAQINQMSYFDARALAKHPVSCIDCHRPDNMQLRVTRPGFMEGIRMFKASQGVKDYDVNRDATRQEMRTYVCGQCHVEYYFKGKEKRLEYPWGKGLTADSILAYHDSTGHKDFTHAISGAPVLKAQHPEFELYNQGIHARSGVACADCHMPYKRQGAMKISDHHVRSPVLNVNRSCQTCHKWTEDELRDRVFTIQDRTFEMRNMAIDAVLQLAKEIAQQVRTDSVGAAANIRLARDYQRKAQFLADFIEAENSMGFHADQEAARILATSIDYSRRGQMALRGQEPPPVTRPAHGTVAPSQRKEGNR
ncbi:MAG TPA: ammonia-forming cytochrome c nitrite reductase subunit c552 [Gemmatimonadaceae bacterium]|nr:ammonia-forming cytochrome c nitrite reductase subunit c552 [Gemmatimonadaceae bacterium]